MSAFTSSVVRLAGNVTVTLVSPLPELGESTKSGLLQVAVHSPSPSTVNEAVVTWGSTSIFLTDTPVGTIALWLMARALGVTSSPMNFMRPERGEVSSLADTWIVKTVASPSFDVLTMLNQSLSWFTT